MFEWLLFWKLIMAVRFLSSFRTR